MFSKRSLVSYKHISIDCIILQRVIVEVYKAFAFIYIIC